MCRSKGRHRKSDADLHRAYLPFESQRCVRLLTLLMLKVAIFMERIPSLRRMTTAASRSNAIGMARPACIGRLTETDLYVEITPVRIISSMKMLRQPKQRNRCKMAVFAKQ